MKKFLIVACWLCSQVLLGQDQSALDTKKGFKDIVLDSDASQYPGLVYKKSESHDKFPEVDIYERNKAHYEDIGGVKIRSMEVVTYKGYIYQINLTTDNDTKLYKGLKKIYGEPKYSVRFDRYVWDGKKLKLSYRANKKGRLEFVYTSYEVPLRLKQEKEAAIEDVASDF